ncbi:FAD binding domain protein [Aspergillus sclerotialis]|uniref:FAD binding domain protein n=1 Tax=Aspergillus sclerotialis TaxID=2070753 RepID=A0A3A2ZWZ7_9EURO|nr:FAD binding domain protein [Aspergillus sclerotialis]
MGSNQADGLSPGKLRVLIAGAGIGGLTAAIALRQQGHCVELFERSRFAEEIGAAIHLCPNANSILHRLGIDATKFGAVEAEKLREFTPSGEHLNTVDVKGNSAFWRHRWLLVHRAHLHEALKAAAQAPGSGIPAQLHTSSKVVDVNPSLATITLENGQTIHGDIVIGADGVHSSIRSKLPGAEHIFPFSSGKNAFRFLITRQQALDDPDTHDIAAHFGALDLWDSPDRRIVIYPCSNNDMLNFVCIHPDTLTKIEKESDWNQQVGKDALLEVFGDFNPQVVKLLEKADPQTLKLWPLLDMDTLPTWVNERLAVIGDAAHPFLPYRASGGAMALEDAVSLGVMLSGDVEPKDIPMRLKLYEKARHERATRIQQMTRDSGKGPIGPEKGKTPLNQVYIKSLTFQATEMIMYIYGHDEFDHSTHILRQHLWRQDPNIYWRQPIVFGPMPGPRQDFNGRSRASASLKSTFKTASIKFKTSRTLLQNLLPNNSYSFISPSTVAYASFSQTTLDRMDWLGGGGYRHFGLYIHGVQYKTASGNLVKGTYLPILFENLADPIVSGREELGMPKLYTAIDVHQRNQSHHVHTSWEGAVWGHFSWEDLIDEDPTGDTGTIGGTQDDGILVYRYIPKVGREFKGQPEAEYPVFVPHAQESKVVASRVMRVRRTKRARVEIDALNWESLPTLYHVIDRLAEIPIDEIIEGKIVEGEGVPDVSSAMRIE